MKDTIKVVGVLLVGLAVALFVYPFFHETGHVIAILIVGLEIYEIKLFPSAYVVCESANVGGVENAIIGISGMLLPLVASLLINSKNFWLWLLSFFLSGISALAFVLSCIAVLCYELEIVWENEDAVKIIEQSEISSSFCLVIMLFLFCLTVLRICFNRPLQRIENYFNI